MKTNRLFYWPLMLVVFASGLMFTGCSNEDSSIEEPQKEEFSLLGKSYGGDMGNNVYRTWSFVSNTKYTEKIIKDGIQFGPYHGTYELVLDTDGKPSHVILTDTKDKDTRIGYFVNRDKFYIDYNSSSRGYFTLIK